MSRREKYLNRLLYDDLLETTGALKTVTGMDPTEGNTPDFQVSALHHLITNSLIVPVNRDACDIFWQTLNIKLTKRLNQLEETADDVYDQRAAAGNRREDSRAATDLNREYLLTKQKEIALTLLLTVVNAIRYNQQPGMLFTDKTTETPLTKLKNTHHAAFKNLTDRLQQLGSRPPDLVVLLTLWKRFCRWLLEKIINPLLGVTPTVPSDRRHPHNYFNTPRPDRHSSHRESKNRHSGTYTTPTST